MAESDDILHLIEDTGTEPPADLNASPEYRAHLAQVLVRRALEAI